LSLFSVLLSVAAGVLLDFAFVTVVFDELSCNSQRNNTSVQNVRKKHRKQQFAIKQPEVTQTHNVEEKKPKTTTTENRNEESEQNNFTGPLYTLSLSQT
jgi:hypothetical protein